MNIDTGWTLPLLTEGAVAVSEATPGRFGSGAAAAVLVTASYVSCGVVGMAVPRLRLSHPNCGCSDVLPRLQPLKVSSKFMITGF
jgi:hypothetical protein